jgi:hypothetical protein
VEDAYSILAIIILLLLALPLVVAIPGFNVCLVAPRRTGLLLSPAFVESDASVFLRAEACECLAVESAVSLGVAVGADLGPNAESLGLGSVLVAGMAGRAVYEEQTRG